MFSYIYNLILYKPLYNLLVAAYTYIPGHDIGVAIIVLTILIRLVLITFTKSQLKSQKAMQDLQPKLEAIKSQYKDNKEKMSQEMMKLYKEEKVNPFSSCLPLLVQLPIFLAVYHVFQAGLSASPTNLVYSFLPNPGHLNAVSFGFFDLSKPNIILAVLAALSQFWQTKMLMAPPVPKVAKSPGAKDEDMMATINKQMMYTMPLMTLIIGIKLPAGLALYWLTTTLFSVAQQYFVLKNKDSGANKNNNVVSGPPTGAVSAN